MLKNIKKQKIIKCIKNKKKYNKNYIKYNIKNKKEIKQVKNKK